MKALLILFAIFTHTAAYAYDLSKQKDIQACKNDPSCYICADEITGAAGQCSEKSAYDRNIQGTDTNRKNMFCPIERNKALCSFIPGTLENENIESVTVTTDFTDIELSSYDWTKHNEYYIGFNLKREILVERYTWVISHGCGGDGTPCPEPATSIYTYKGLKDKNVISIDIGGKVLTPGSRIYFDAGNFLVQNLSLRISAKIKMQVPDNNYICPIDNTLPCLDINGDGTRYECSKSPCISGSNISITNPDASEDDLAGEAPTNPADAENCDPENVRLSPGQYLTCRKASTTNMLANNCCDNGLANEEAKEGIKMGTYEYFTFWLPTWSLVSAIGGWIGGLDIIQSYFNEAVEWMFGGTCDENELKLSTLKSTTENNGNCIYMGDFCSNYRGSCIQLGGANLSVWGCERPASAYCCYDNIMDKAIAKAARDQLKIGWGKIPTGPGSNPCNPDKNNINVDCRGITLEEFMKLNLSHPQFKTDMQEYVNVMIKDITGSGEGSINEYMQNSEKMVQDIVNFYK